MEAITTCCKNCGNLFRGYFCNNCGQKYNISRITWKEVFHNIPHMLFHLDDGFFYTIKELFVRPGHTIREYLEGKRKYHFNPFVLLLILAGLCSTLYVYFNLSTILASISLHKLEEQNEFIAHKFFATRTIIFCLICSIGDYLIFYSHKYNLAEMVAANVMMFCAVTVLQLSFLPLLLLGQNLDHLLPIQITFLVLVIAYLFYARYQFYEVRGQAKLMLRIVMAILFYLFTFFEIARQMVKPVLEN